LVKDIELLEKVQKRAKRMIEGCASKTFEKSLKIFGLSILECRRLRADLIEVFKIQKGFEVV